MDKTTAGILVDYDYYMQNHRVQGFLYRKANHASIIALVSNPVAQDPDHRADHPDNLEFDVVIRNTKGLPDEVFKLAALNALSAYSNVYPALAIDLFNEELYDDAGVLLTLDGRFFG